MRGYPLPDGDVCHGKGSGRIVLCPRDPRHGGRRRGDERGGLRRLYSKGKIYTVTGADNDLSYRHSRFTDSGEIVLEAVFRLEPGDPEKIREEIRDLAERRRKSQPLDQRSAGSTFKRPATGYAAAMIEQAGLKGLTVGGAQVSEKHAGFVINRGGATCEDVRELMRQVQQAVREKFGTELEPEVKLWSL